MDGSALFFASRDLYPGAPLNYEALTTCLREAAWSAEFGSDPQKGPCGIFPPLLQPGAMNYPPPTPWIMWSAVSQKNEGQARFLGHVHGLGWDVRRFAPADSFTVDPVTTLSLSAGSRIGERLTRFDASIAYMIGRVATTAQIVLLSDSFALAEPLIRAAKTRYDTERRIAEGEDREPKQMPPNILAFFGRALDPRWFPLLRDWRQDGMSDCVRFFDLEPRAHHLFGVSPVRERPWLDADIPDRRTPAEVDRARLFQLEEEKQRRKRSKGGHAKT